jgi:hypothetical protein
VRGGEKQKIRIREEGRKRGDNRRNENKRGEQ